MGFEVFAKEPKSADVQRLLTRITKEVDSVPHYVVSDKGSQFDSRDFRAWCTRRGIKARYASAGSLRASAMVERFIRSLKDEWLRRILIPPRADAMRRELTRYTLWFETHRPHQGIDGRTPLEVYERRRPRLRSELDRTRPISMTVRFQEGRKQLPIVELKHAA
jgi:transposase InsO family protein